MRIRTLHRGHSIDELEQTLPHMREESGGPISWELIGKPNSKPSLIWGCYCVYMRLARFFWMKNDPQVVWRETTEKTVGPSNISRIPLHIISYYCGILLVHNLFSCVPRFLDFCTGCVYHGYLQESIPPTHTIYPVVLGSTGLSWFVHRNAGLTFANDGTHHSQSVRTTFWEGE